MPYIGMTHEYENFLRQNNTGEIERRTSVNPVSAEWIGDDTDSEASYMTDGEINHRRMSMDSDISDISDFSLSDTEDENGDDSDEEDPYVQCVSCNGSGGQIWSELQRGDHFICRACFTSDPNNINCQETRNLLTTLGREGVQEILREENLSEIQNSEVFNPDEQSNLETNHQGLEYLSVESVFELVTHGGFLTRADFNHLLDIVAFVLYRPAPDTGNHIPLSQDERTIYRSINASLSGHVNYEESPLIELEIPCNERPWSYPSNNTQTPPVMEVHNLYLMEDYPAIVATCALYMTHNFTKIIYN